MRLTEKLLETSALTLWTEFSLLFIGRDGLTHNMLDNIHAHWKRRRVCKIKCKGVCTVDMDNVCQQLEVCFFHDKDLPIWNVLLVLGINIYAENKSRKQGY